MKRTPLVHCESSGSTPEAIKFDLCMATDSGYIFCSFVAA